MKNILCHQFIHEKHLNSFIYVLDIYLIENAWCILSEIVLLNRIEITHALLIPYLKATAVKAPVMANFTTEQNTRFLANTDTHE